MRPLVHCYPDRLCCSQEQFMAAHASPVLICRQRRASPGHAAACHMVHTLLFDANTRVLLADNGSTNGTYVSGWRIPARESAEVRCGALCQFGDCQSLFFRPASLPALLGE